MFWTLRVTVARGPKAGANCCEFAVCGLDRGEAQRAPSPVLQKDHVDMQDYVTEVDSTVNMNVIVISIMCR